MEWLGFRFAVPDFDEVVRRTFELAGEAVGGEAEPWVDFEA